MKEFEKISIRGRMAYLLCMLEKLLLYYGCKKDEWSWVMKKFWNYTSVQYFDDWIYEISEYMPENIKSDEFEEFEEITFDEYIRLKKLYENLPEDISNMMNIIFEFASTVAYTRFLDNNPSTIKRLEKGMEILQKNKIDIVDYRQFEKYRFTEEEGWGKQFDGGELSMFFE